MKSPAARPNLIGQIRRLGWIPGMLIVAALVLFTPLSLPTGLSTERTIRIEASMFSFSPGQVQINPGDRVTIELVSTDVVHGFSLDGHDFDLTADPGQTVTGTFIADQPGVFSFRCSAPCGNLHPFMIGKLQVGPNLLLIRGIVLGILAAFAAIISTSKSTGFKGLASQ